MALLFLAPVESLDGVFGLQAPAQCSKSIFWYLNSKILLYFKTDSSQLRDIQSCLDTGIFLPPPFMWLFQLMFMTTKYYSQS